MDVCRAHPDALEVRALAARSPSEKLTALAAEFGVTMFCVHDAPPGLGPEEPGSKKLRGPGGLIAVAEDPLVDHVVFASSKTAATTQIGRASCRERV